MTSRGKGRGKKSADVPLGSLGKGDHIDNDLEQIDLSHIRKPIDTSLFGLKQVVNLLETATEEVRQYIAYECDMIYECRVCRTIFRSLANFILHKRNYCRERFTCKANAREPLLDIIACEGDDSCDSDKQKRDLKSVVERLCAKKRVEEDNEETENDGNNTTKIILEKINSSGVFQTITNSMNKRKSADFMKTEVMEIHNILDNNEAILGPDGKVMNVENQLSKKTLTCNSCKHKFSTKKTLIYHIKYKHNDSRIIYPCPDCKETFPNAWSVFRHLYKTHRRTAAEVRKIRDFVHTSALQRWQVKQCEQATDGGEEGKNSEMQQWLDSVEGDNDLQMCGGCGKRFERKAALHSHSQLCAKRIALCGTMKDGKKIDVEEKAAGEKQVQVQKEQKTLKGAGRRKPLHAIKKLKSHAKSDDSIEHVSPPPHDDKSDADSRVIAPSSDTISDACAATTTNKSSDSTAIAMTDFDHFQDALNFNHDDYLLQSTGLCQKLDADIKSTVKDIQDLYENHVYESALDAHAHTDAKPTKRRVRRRAPTTQQPTKTTTRTRMAKSDTPKKRKPRKETTKKRSPPEKIQLKDACAQSPTPNCNFAEIARVDCECFALLEQTATKYMDREVLQCRACDDYFTTYDLLMEHMATHFNWYLYQCSQCDFMAYSKRICFGHVEMTHGRSGNAALNNVVVPVPNWKAISLSVDFTAQRYVETIQGKTIKTEIETCDKPTVDQSVADANYTCVVEADPTLDTEDEQQPDEPTMQDPQIRKMVMEVIFGSDPSAADTPSLQSSGAGSPEDKQRPVRNRVSTVQKDFLYDMAALPQGRSHEVEYDRDGGNNTKKSKGVRVYGKRKRMNADIVKNCAAMDAAAVESASDNDSDFA